MKDCLWLEPNLAICSSDADVEEMLRGHFYENLERIHFGLPQGYKGMSIAKGEDIEIRYYPYYLGILKYGKEYVYIPYRIDNGQRIPDFGGNFLKADYAPVIEKLKALSAIKENDVKNPVYFDSYLTKDSKPLAENGVRIDQNTGNYEWQLQDFQIEELLGLGENQKCKPHICRRIANNRIACLTSYEAGKIVKIIKTEEQRNLLRQASRKSLKKEDRKKLFEAYLRGETPDLSKKKDKEKQEASKEIVKEIMKEEKAVQIEKKDGEEKMEASLLQIFQEYTEKNQRGNIRVWPESNQAIVKDFNQKFPQSYLQIGFEESEDDSLQFVYLRLHNYLQFPAEKINDMYKLCNELNMRYVLVSFAVNEKDCRLTSTMRSAVLRENCGPGCWKAIEKLMDYSLKLFPSIIREITSQTSL